MQTPAAIDFAKATSVADAIAKLESLGEEARPVAGGYSLLPMMKLRLAFPSALVDVHDIPELQGVKVEGDELVVGAMTRHRDILSSAVLSEHYPVFREAERVIADPIVRARGTIGGSLCQADPASDLSAVGSALKGTAVIEGRGGRRSVPLREFHEGPYETVVGPAELLVELRYPIRPGAGSAYEKVERRAGDWGVCTSGVYVVVRGGVVAECGIGLAAVNAPHYCSPAAEAALTGQAPTEENLLAAASAAAAECEPSADQRGPVDYKRHLAQELTLRALRRAVAASQGV
ncbi:MAG TPA: xanthine dehydrogenase family protein subunit M [Candidatus Nanopelagicales bacterium]|nr:xanthine dehydrogenase family protein subunit M [Candidatus Nanopelagicales bacterium]